MFSFYKRSPKSLICADSLYKSVISKLPSDNRIKYCESLIYRTSEDLSNSKCIFKKRKLTKLLEAAKGELKDLNK